MKKIERFPGDCPGYIYESRFGNPGYIGDSDVPNGIKWEAPAIEEFWVYIEDRKGTRLDITETLSEEFLEKAMEYCQRDFDTYWDGRLGMHTHHVC
jgi:hypothetical protein